MKFTYLVLINGTDIIRGTNVTEIASSWVEEEGVTVIDTENMTVMKPAGILDVSIRVF